MSDVILIMVCSQPPCVAPLAESTPFVLNDTSLRAYFERSGVLAYRIKNLRLEYAYAVSPCEPGVTRWWRAAHTPCTASEEVGAATAIDSDTAAAITAAFAASGDINAYYRDIDVRATIAARESGSCSNSFNGVQTMGAQLTIGGSCWRHVPNVEGNVYSFSWWSMTHAGNDQFERSQNPILRWAKAGLTYIELPRGHSMTTRWREAVDKYPNRYVHLIGRYGDVVDFATLQHAVQPREMADFLGAVELVRPPLVVCGSPYEVASDPTLGHRYKVFLSGEEFGMTARLYPHGGNEGKQMVWSTVVLSAPDQLRQRMAFALSQILVINEEGTGKQDEHENWLVYYDIFGRAIQTRHS